MKVVLVVSVTTVWDDITPPCAQLNLDRQCKLTVEDGAPLNPDTRFLTLSVRYNTCVYRFGRTTGVEQRYSNLCCLEQHFPVGEGPQGIGSLS